MSELAIGDRKIRLILGDITLVKADAIVNAANEPLLPGGGVCGAIHRAGGPAIAEGGRSVGHTPTARAAVTAAGALPAQCVIPAVGPIWRGGGSGEAALLASAYRSSL